MLLCRATRDPGRSSHLYRPHTLSSTTPAAAAVVRASPPADGGADVRVSREYPANETELQKATRRSTVGEEDHHVRLRQSHILDFPPFFPHFFVVVVVAVAAVVVVFFFIIGGGRRRCHRPMARTKSNMKKAEKAFWKRLRLVPVKRDSFQGGSSRY